MLECICCCIFILKYFMLLLETKFQDDEIPKNACGFLCLVSYPFDVDGEGYIQPGEED